MMKSEKAANLYDLIIIGAASAGLTSAIYTSRQGLKTLVISKDMGGQALLTNDIENYPGFLSIGGFELMSKFEEQAKYFGTSFVYDEVHRLEEKNGVSFSVSTPTQEFESTALILAFGKTPRDLGVPGEQELKGRGVSYCAVCDGPFFKNKPVAVVGAGDPALDAAAMLSDLVGKVHFIHRYDKPVGDEELVDRVTTKSNVEELNNSIVVQIAGKQKVDSVIIRNLKSNEEKELEVDGVFIEMGYIAKTDFVKGLVQLNANKEIMVDKFCNTSHPGIFAAGDVTDVPFKQAVVSAGQGCIAALTAYNYIQKLKGKPAAKADWKALIKKEAKRTNSP